MASSSVVGDEDGGVGQGRLRTPFDPPFTTFLPDEESTRQDETPVGHRHDAHALEMGPLSGHVPRVGALDNNSRATDSTAPPPPQANSKAPNDRSLWKVIFFPCALCCGSQTASRKKNGELPVRRRPSTTPVLHPAHRYCHRDRIVKPYRAHHCRSCGTVSLKAIVMLASK